jgi:hypothetical protein
MTATAWRKATASMNTGACVEVAGWRRACESAGCVEVAAADPLMPQFDGIAVRDSVLGDASPHLVFTARAFRAFTATLKDGGR